MIFFVDCLIFIIRAVRKIKNFENWMSNDKVGSAVFEQFQAAIVESSQNLSSIFLLSLEGHMMEIMPQTTKLSDQKENLNICIIFSWVVSLHYINYTVHYALVVQSVFWLYTLILKVEA